MELTLKKAFELSIEKWERIIQDNGQNTFKDMPQLNSLLNECGMCEYYRQDCSECVINCGFDDGCNNTNHVYLIWSNHSTITNAQAVLDLINEKYAAHLKRYYK